MKHCFDFLAFRTETRTATPAHCLQETEVCDCTSQHPVWPQLRADSGREGCYAPFFRLRERTRSAGAAPGLEVKHCFDFLAFRTETRTATPARCLQETEVHNTPVGPS